MNDFLYQMMLSFSILLASDVIVTSKIMIRGISLYVIIGIVLKVTHHPMNVSIFMAFLQLIIVTIMIGKFDQRILKGYLITAFIEISISLIMMLVNLDFQLLEGLITIGLLLIGKHLHLLTMDAPLHMIGFSLLGLFLVSIMNNISVMSTKDLILHLLVSGFVLILFIMLDRKQRQLQDTTINIQIKQSYIQTLVNRSSSLRMYKHDTQARLLAVEDYLRRQDYQGLEYFLQLNTEKLKDLKPFSPHQEIDIIMQYFHQNYPQVKLEVNDDIYGIITMEHEQCFLLLYNLVLNAYESTLMTENPYVSCHFSSHQRTLNLLIQNRVPDLFDPSVLKKRQTTKTHGHHGYGLKTIHQIVDQYHGLCHYEVTENILTNKIVLFECIHDKM